MLTRSLPLQERMALYDRAIHLREEKNCGYKRVAKELDISRSTIEKWLSRGAKPRTYHYVPNLKPSPELSYMVGVLLGDGWVFKSGVRYMLGLEVADKAFSEGFERALMKLGFHVGKQFIRSKNIREKDMFVVYASSLFFYDWWQNFKSSLVYNLRQLGYNNEFMLAFIRGFYESEGSVSYPNKGLHREIRIFNTCLEVSKIVKDFLQELGYHPYFYAQKYREKGIYYTVGLSRKEETERFFDEVRPCIKTGVRVDPV